MGLATFDVHRLQQQVSCVTLVACITANAQAVSANGTSALFSAYKYTVLLEIAQYATDVNVHRVFRFISRVCVLLSCTE